jgi:hypothetical protein
MMTIDEQDMAILRIVKERGEAKRRKVLIESELRAAGESLYDIGGALRHVNDASVQNGVESVLPKLANVPKICDLGRVKLMLEELKELENRLSQLNRSASDLGID